MIAATYNGTTVINVRDTRWALSLGSGVASVRNYRKVDAQRKVRKPDVLYYHSHSSDGSSRYESRPVTPGINKWAVQFSSSPADVSFAWYSNPYDENGLILSEYASTITGAAAAEDDTLEGFSLALLNTREDFYLSSPAARFLGRNPAKVVVAGDVLLEEFAFDDGLLNADLFLLHGDQLAGIWGLKAGSRAMVLPVSEAGWRRFYSTWTEPVVADSAVNVSLTSNTVSAVRSFMQSLRSGVIKAYPVCFFKGAFPSAAQDAVGTVGIVQTVEFSKANLQSDDTFILETVAWNASGDAAGQYVLFKALSEESAVLNIDSKAAEASAKVQQILQQAAGSTVQMVELFKKDILKTIRAISETGKAGSAALATLQSNLREAVCEKLFEPAFEANLLDSFKIKLGPNLLSRSKTLKSEELVLSDDAIRALTDRGDWTAVDKELAEMLSPYLLFKAGSDDSNTPDQAASTTESQLDPLALSDATFDEYLVGIQNAVRAVYQKVKDYVSRTANWGGLYDSFLQEIHDTYRFFGERTWLRYPAGWLYKDAATGQYVRPVMFMIKRKDGATWTVKNFGLRGGWFNSDAGQVTGTATSDLQEVRVSASHAPLVFRLSMIVAIDLRPDPAHEGQYLPALDAKLDYLEFYARDSFNFALADSVNNDPRYELTRYNDAVREILKSIFSGFDSDLEEATRVPSAPGVARRHNFKNWAKLDIRDVAVRNGFLYFPLHDIGNTLDPAKPADSEKGDFPAYESVQTIPYQLMSPMAFKFCPLKAAEQALYSAVPIAAPDFAGAVKNWTNRAVAAVNQELVDELTEFIKEVDPVEAASRLPVALVRQNVLSLTAGRLVASGLSLNLSALQTAYNQLEARLSQMADLSPNNQDLQNALQTVRALVRDIASFTSPETTDLQVAYVNNLPVANAPLSDALCAGIAIYS